MVGSDDRPGQRGRMSQDELKRLVGEAALAYVPPGSVDRRRHRLDRELLHRRAGRRCPAASPARSRAARRARARLRATASAVLEASEVESLPVYIDGADEIDAAGCMIKGGGAALTREKIVADLAERFVCIADESKLVARLGRFPLPVEVIPMAAAQVARRFAAIGGRPVLRDGVVTDNGGHILDVHGLAIDDPAAHGEPRSASGRAWSASASSPATGRPSVCSAPPTGVRTLTFLTRGGRARAKARNLRPVHVSCSTQEGRPVAKPNYSFEKRQRELAKKKKKEEKEKEKAGRKVGRRARRGASRARAGRSGRRPIRRRWGRPAADAQPAASGARRPSRRNGATREARRVDRIEQVGLRAATAPR